MSMCVHKILLYHCRNTASETVRSLLVYGYVLDPPTGDVEAAEVKASLHPTHRTYRAEKTYGVSSGKWYYEVEILSPGSVSLGWALTDAAPDAALGRIYAAYDSLNWTFLKRFFSVHFDSANLNPDSSAAFKLITVQLHRKLL